MAHDIEVAKDGTASFFSGEGLSAWHGLGTVVEGTLTAAEALKTAGLDWQVDLLPAWYKVGEDFRQIPDRFAVVRDSDQKALGVVGSDYVPFQNVEAFSFFDTVTDSTGEAHYTTAGALAGGSKVFMTAKIGETFNVAGEDAHDMYLILSTSHDGTKALTAMVSMIRVVCANTLTMALNDARHKWSIAHRTTLSGKVQEAREALKLSYKYQTAFEAEAEALYQIPVTADDFRNVIAHALPEQKRQKARNIDDLMGIWLSETTVNDASGAGTGWAAMNAATYWTDHVKPSRSEEALFKSVNGGAAAAFRNNVRAGVLSLV